MLPENLLFHTLPVCPDSFLSRSVQRAGKTAGSGVVLDLNPPGCGSLRCLASLNYSFLISEMDITVIPTVVVELQ